MSLIFQKYIVCMKYGLSIHFFYQHTCKGQGCNNSDSFILALLQTAFSEVYCSFFGLLKQFINNILQHLNHAVVTLFSHDS